MKIKIGNMVYVTKSYLPKEVMRINFEDNCFTATDWTLWSFNDIVCLGDNDEN